jgi:2-amino-4-hydroxy-6-hydroxymethyldihydropteridine diphosphokinase
LSRGASRPAYVAIGSNLADPQRQVERAFEALAGLPATKLVRRSGLWRSRPMGPQDQPEYVNAAAGILTTLGPRELLEALQTIERRMGRTSPVAHWGPRLIDLDLVVYSDECRDEPGLTLPHPGLHQRNFVLYPLAEIAAELWVPGYARVCRLREQVSPEGIERLAERGSGDD